MLPCLPIHLAADQRAFLTYRFYSLMKIYHWKVFCRKSGVTALKNWLLPSLEQICKTLDDVCFCSLDDSVTRRKISAVGRFFPAWIKYRVITDNHPGETSWRKSISHDLSESLNKTSELDPAPLQVDFVQLQKEVNPFYDLSVIDLINDIGEALIRRCPDNMLLSVLQGGFLVIIGRY